MSAIYPTMIGMYWLFLSGIVYLAGTAIISLFVTTPSGADRCIIDGKGRSCGETVSLLAFYIAAISLVANVIHIILHCSVMTETDLKEVWGILPSFLSQTYYGRISSARTVLHFFLAVTAGISIFRKNRAIESAWYLLIFTILITISMSGHQGTKGIGNLNFYIDVSHLVAISTWIGGIIHLRFGYQYILQCESAEYTEKYVTVINRFSLLATVSVFVVFVTGLWMALISPHGPVELIKTGFGKVLMAKIVLAIIVASIGGANKFIIIPGINRASESGTETIGSFRKAFHRAVTAEAFGGLAVLLVTSVLTHMSPMD